MPRRCLVPDQTTSQHQVAKNLKTYKVLRMSRTALTPTAHKAAKPLMERGFLKTPMRQQKGSKRVWSTSCLLLVVPKHTKNGLMRTRPCLSAQ
eukprot:5704134-Amphidinium_carterae.1